MNLQAHSLTLGYGERPVVSGLDIGFTPGRITAVIGPNGCGKSTLMRALAGLLAPAAGHVALGDAALAAWPRKRLARNLAFLPQSPVAPDGMSVRRVIEHGRFSHQGFFALASAEDRDVVQWAIDQVELSALADRPFASLSGGERQRGWIALALAQKPKWLLLDEPTTYLDIGHQFEVLDLLSGLNRRDGLGIVMVLHDINQAAAYADRIVAMRAGTVIADGPPAETVTPGLMRALFGIDVEVVALGEGRSRRPHCIARPAHLASLP